MEKNRTTTNQLATLLLGVLLLFFGIAIVAGPILDYATIWLPAVLIFAGLFTLPTGSPHHSHSEHNYDPYAEDKMRKAEKHSRTATLVAVALLLVGVYFIFREVGIIETPVLRNLFGAGIILTGLYGIVVSSLWIFKHAGKPTTKPTDKHA